MATSTEPFAVPAPRRVLVVGDIMLDRYTWGRADRVSPEAPVLVIRAESCEVRLGGAGAVAALLRGLDADVVLAGVVGEDHEGATVRRLLHEAGIVGRMLLTDSARPTTLKERFLATVEQRQPHQILRVDYEQTDALARDLADQLAEAVERELRAIVGLTPPRSPNTAGLTPPRSPNLGERPGVSPPVGMARGPT
jgi:D-beta-D-heptose 7-phosphate kinase / D-beta-D-heptose 1-phosphate adenosyltransferase